MDRDSSVVVATWYGRLGDRILVDARFSETVQTGAGAHPASSKMGTRSFPGVKRPGRDIDHQPTSSAEVKERVELYLYSSSEPSCPVLWWTSMYSNFLNHNIFWISLVDISASLDYDYHPVIFLVKSYVRL